VLQRLLELGVRWLSHTPVEANTCQGPGHEGVDQAHGEQPALNPWLLRPDRAKAGGDPKPRSSNMAGRCAKPCLPFCSAMPPVWPIRLADQTRHVCLCTRRRWLAEGLIDSRMRSMPHAGRVEAADAMAQVKKARASMELAAENRLSAGEGFASPPWVRRSLQLPLVRRQHLPGIGRDRCAQAARVGFAQGIHQRWAASAPKEARRWTWESPFSRR